MRRLCVPQSLSHLLYPFYHDEAGHAGINRACHALIQQFYVPHVRQHFARYIRQCPACQRAKPHLHLTYGQLHPIPTP